MKTSFYNQQRCQRSRNQRTKSSLYKRAFLNTSYFAEKNTKLGNIIYYWKKLESRVFVIEFIQRPSRESLDVKAPGHTPDLETQDKHPSTQAASIKEENQKIR